MKELCKKFGVYDPTAIQLIKNTLSFAKCQGSTEEGADIFRSIVGETIQMGRKEILALIEDRPLVAGEVFEMIPKDIIALLNVMKKRELQLEYLRCVKGLCCESHKDRTAFPLTNHAGKWMLCVEDIAELCGSAKDTIKLLEEIIPEKELKELDEGETEVFTLETYGRQFWNEIQLPPLTNQYFKVLKEIVESEREYTNDKSKYLVSLYDMSDKCLEFDSLFQLEGFIDHVDCAPATVYGLEMDDSCYSELYSF